MATLPKIAAKQRDLPPKTLQQIALAAKRLEQLDMAECFDPFTPTSRPTKPQEEFFKEFGKIRIQVIRGGNQCLAKGTLVATSMGPVPIEDIQPGMIVYSEHGQPIVVKDKFATGIKPVVTLTNRKKIWARATAEHRWLIQDGHSQEKERITKDFKRDDQVKRVHVKAPLGNINIAEAYVIGALLGDGCSRQSGICISSVNDLVPQKIAQILNGTIKRVSVYNYTWKIQGSHTPRFYNEWCKGRYAHEKLVDLSQIKTWNRESLLNFVAGLIDTDGTIHPAKDFIRFALSMQAKSVVEAFKYAVLALWQVNLSTQVYSKRYKNGPLHVAYTHNAKEIRLILSELDSYLVSPQKKWREEYNTLGGKRTGDYGIGLKLSKYEESVETFDLEVDSPTHLYLLANGLVTHNSSKTSTAARNIAWCLSETHPHWKRPPEWGHEPLLIILCGRSSKIIENSIHRRIAAFFGPGELKDTLQSNSLQSTVHVKTGNKIIYQSYENVNVARERLQSYTAHIVWVDEMPSSFQLFDELLRRVQAKSGYLMATFTPLIVNGEIRKFCDTLEEKKIGKTYRFKMFDNPIYASKAKQDEILAELSTTPEHIRNARLYGDWVSQEGCVYYFDSDLMVRPLPDYYSRNWRHVEASDPGLDSAHGLIVFAEDPTTGFWYVIKADYLRGLYDPNKLVQAVMEETKYYNIVTRVADSASTWYIYTAEAKGLSYITPYAKNDRRDEMIKGLQQKLGKTLFLTPDLSSLIDEIQTCRWSDSDKQTIVHRRKYHLLEALRYGQDCLPEMVQQHLAIPWQQALYEADKLRREKEAKRAQQNTGHNRAGGVRSSEAWKNRLPLGRHRRW